MRCVIRGMTGERQICACRVVTGEESRGRASHLPPPRRPQSLCADVLRHSQAAPRIGREVLPHVTTPANPLVYLPQRMASARLKYPGLISEEILVLSAWLKVNEAQFAHFDYNVKIGPDYVSDVPLSPEVQRDANFLHKLRIDAVAWRGVVEEMLPPIITHPSQVYALFPSALATIIDAKRRATNKVIGQLINYRDLWRVENPEAATPDLVCVCATYSATILPSVAAQNIQLNVLAVDFSPLRPRKP
jgi:hypothetical protein